MTVSLWKILAILFRSLLCLVWNGYSC